MKIIGFVHKNGHISPNNGLFFNAKPPLESLEPLLFDYKNRGECLLSMCTNENEYGNYYSCRFYGYISLLIIIYHVITIKLALIMAVNFFFLHDVLTQGMYAIVNRT